MHLTRLLATASAAALIACPVLAAAATDTTPPAATPAPPAAAAPALPSIPKVAPGADIYDTLKAAGDFTILVKAIDATNLKATLTSVPNLTLFAPTDAAFNALPPDQLAKLTAPGDAAANQLQQILIYHLIGAAIDSSHIKGAKGPLPTAEKSTVLLDGSNPDDLLVNNADIIQADIRVTNGGIIHVVDKVLVPPDSPYAAALAPPPPASAAAPAAAPAS
jgi:uncharacterized surface protein with fasciclin (FAS1) repeats